MMLNAWCQLTTYYNCSPFQTVNTSGCSYTFLKSELKDTHKQSLKIFEHENIVLCTYQRNLFLNLKQFHHRWKLLKTIDFHTYQGVLFLFFTVIAGYFNGFIYEIMVSNISKIKHHSYNVLNLQVYVIVLVLTHGSL